MDQNVGLGTPERRPRGDNALVQAARKLFSFSDRLQSSLAQDAMSAALMAQLAREARLSVLSQFTYWDAEMKIGTPRYGDRITHLRREAEA